MSSNWETHLNRWTAAGVLDATSADRIRQWERENGRSHGLRWPVLIALVFGALLLCSGVLLFVSAHWDELPPSGRMTLVLLMVSVFHAGGAAVASRFHGLSIALHTVGTVSLGPGIALTGQIFHLSEHWPAAVMLWAAGAALAWLLLGHWPQAALTAILVPWWLAGEWVVWNEGSKPVLAANAGLCALSFVYLSARRGPDDSAVRKALGWIGGLALLPLAFVVAVESWRSAPPVQEQIVGWVIAALGPMAVAFILRGKSALWAAPAVIWTFMLAALNAKGDSRTAIYLWCAVGAIGLTAWGVREARPERINLGIAGFAITVIAFYFASVMDKLGRSASLIVAGLLFLGGGWLLERMRRQLLARLNQEVL